MADIHTERWLYLHKARVSFDMAKAAADPAQAVLHMDMHLFYLGKVDELGYRDHVRARQSATRHSER